MKSVIFGALVLGTLSMGAMADVGWTGSGNTPLWSNADNWDTPPIPGGVMHFAGAFQLDAQNDISNNFTYDSIIFDVGADSFILSGLSIGLTGTMGGGIINNSGTEQTLQFTDYGAGQGGIYLKNSLRFDAANGALAINSNITSFDETGTNGALTLTVTGGFNTRIQGYLNEDNSGIYTDSVLSLLKTGTGTLTVSALNNTYHGTTTVSAGTMVVSGSLENTSSVTVDTGATLELTHNAFINTSNAVTVNGVLTLDIVGDRNTNLPSSVGPLNLHDNSTLNFTIDAHDGISQGVTTASTHAILSVNGITLATGGGGVTLSINNTGYTPTASNDLSDITKSDRIILVLNTGGLSGSFTGNVVHGVDTGYAGVNNNDVYTDNLGNAWAIIYNADGGNNTFGSGHDIVLYLIPEPSTWAMLLGGFAVLGFIQRIRRRLA